jgi:glutamate-1-semialdehyde aminotransferase
MAAGDAISLTYGDEALSLAAAKAALTVQLEQDVSGHIWRVGTALQKGLQAAIDESGVPFDLTAIPPMLAFVETGQFRATAVTPKDQRRAWVYLLAELARRGVIHRRNSSFLLSYSHTAEDIDHLVTAFGEVFVELAEHLKADTLADLIDDSPVPIFRRL